MKFTCPIAALKTITKNCIKAVPGKPVYPILSHLLIKTIKDEGEEEQVVVMTGFDLSLAIEQEAVVEIEEDGAVAVPAKLFGDLVNKLPEEKGKGRCTLSTSCEEGGKIQLTVEVGRTKMVIACESADDYPELPALRDPVEISFSGVLLGQVIRSALVSVGWNDDTKPITCNAYFVLKSEVLDVVTTDGHRLTRCQINLEEANLPKEGLLIPAQCLARVLTLIPADGDKSGEKFVTIGYDAGEHPQTAVFWGNNLTITTRLGAGTYPQYESLIPADFDWEVTTDGKALGDVLYRLAPLAEQSDGCLVAMKIDFIQNQLTFSVQARDVGEGMEVLPASCKILKDVEAATVRVALNHKYLKEAINEMKTGEVTLSGQINTRFPIIARPPAQATHSLTQLIMQVQERS